MNEYNYLCGVMASTSPISNLHKHQANIYIQGEQRFTEFAENSLQIKSYSVVFIPNKWIYNRNKINHGNVKTSAGLYCFFPLLYCPGWFWHGTIKWILNLGPLYCPGWFWLETIKWISNLDNLINQLITCLSRCVIVYVLELA